MSVIGCYSMDLYCDTGGDSYAANCPHRPHFGAQGEYTGRTEGECLKQAKEDGWTFKKRHTYAYCPKCNKGTP